MIPSYVTAPHSGCHGDLFYQLAEYFAPFCVGSALLVLYGTPFIVTRHKIPPDPIVSPEDSLVLRFFVLSFYPSFT
jgi:hypothetical protein